MQVPTCMRFARTFCTFAFPRLGKCATIQFIRCLKRATWVKVMLLRCESSQSQGRNS
jgi:hypothetical protein